LIPTGAASFLFSRLAPLPLVSTIQLL
jgi:hypothetical protein